MLNVQKKVITGVSNDLELFKKELIKSYAWLNRSEIEELKKWVIKNFYTTHAEIIDDVFQEKRNSVA